jgi:uncharacterized membrane protein (GlpM family)
MKMTIIRNLLIVIGIYWLSMWVAVPIKIIHSKITYGNQYIGDLGMLRMSLVDAIPTALVAIGAGILSVYTLEGRSRKYWLAVLALLYFIFAFLGLHWVTPPRIIDRLSNLVQFIVPAIACFLAGYIALNNLQSKKK